MPFFAFLGPLFQCRDYNIQQLYDNRRIDVRRDTHRKYREFTEGTTGKQIQQAKQASIIEEFFNSRRIYSGDWDMRSQSEYGKHDKRKCYLLPQLRNLENVRKG